MMGRDGVFQIIEVDDGVPNPFGQNPLECVDFVVHPKALKLIPNPKHGDKRLSEEYREHRVLCIS